MKKILISGVLSALLFTGVQAKDISSATLIEIAGKQRMLSQRMVKDYLYMGRNIAKSKAKFQLLKTFEEFESGKKTILKNSGNEKINNLLAFVDMSLNDFKDIVEEEFSVDNAKVALDLSEALFEGSQFIVDDLKKSYSADEITIIAKAGKQRMLAQRIAKYYIAYQTGVKDQNTIDQVKEAVLEFTETHKLLMSNKNNTPEINKKLKAVDNLWGIVFKFYNDIENGGLPFIVFTSTDKITKNMNEITELYVQTEK